MARNTLAARSLRHLRFARRMLVSQPLLARASMDIHPGYHPIYIALDGRRLPLGHIVRRLPRYDAPRPSDFTAGESSVTDSAPAETGLRLLPPMSESGARGAFADMLPDTPPTTKAPAMKGDEPLRSAAATPATPEATRIEPARPNDNDGRRPRSRIVELPGILIQPIEPERDEGVQGDEIDMADIPADMPTTTGVDTQPDEQAEPASTRDALSSAPHPGATSPDAAPRRGGKRGVQPPRASDALFPPTDSDRSPQSWLARLQQGQQGQQGQQSAPGTSAHTPPKPVARPAAPTPDDQPPVRGSSRGQRGARAGARSAEKVAQPASAEAHTAKDDMASSSARPEQPSRAVEQPVLLSASTRAALHEATGVDPASARIYRGPVAARVASDQNADALTDGATIALGAGHATDTPETLGLLAHELTHVAQRRAPRFVPPAALAAPAPTKPLRSRALLAAPDEIVGETQPQIVAPPVSPADEEAQEAQATLVESRVTHVARARQAVSFSAPVAAPESPVRERQTPQSAPRPRWGALPAPWEPLPDWLSATDGATAPTATQRQSAPATPPSAASSYATGRTQAPGVPGAGTQRAERGRSMPAAPDETTREATAHQGGAPEPDLDALAQQVHAILKRRLAAERRRFG